MATWYRITLCALALGRSITPPPPAFGLSPGELRLVADLAPGALAAPSPRPRLLAALPDAVLFSFDDSLTGTELWRSDGTSAGTFQLADLCRGRCSLGPLWPADFVGSDRRLFFWAQDDEHGRELHATDGTPAGTRLLVDLEPGSRSAFYTGWALTAGGELVFSAQLESSGRRQQLWSSDGTGAGTRLLLDIPGAEGSFLRVLGAVPSGVVFTIGSQEHGQELWITLGTSGRAQLVADIRPGAASGIDPYRLWAISHRGQVFFPADDGEHGVEVWRTDGTAGGTRLVRDLAAGSLPSNPVLPKAIGPWVYFMARRTGGAGAVWRSDGTAKGTVPLREILGFEPDILRLLDSAIQLGERLLFRRSDAAHGDEVWVSEGSPKTTRLLADLNPGPEGSASSQFTALGRHAYFLAHTGGGTELWRSDGTPAGTRRLLRGRLNAGFSALARLRRHLILSHDHAASPSSLWTSDGTAAGTHRFLTFSAGARSSDPRHLTATAGALFFVADDGVYGRELWRTDGTGAGPRLVADLLPPGFDRGIPGAGPRQLTPLNGRLLFQLPFDNALWSVLGSGEGLIPLRPASHALARLGELAYFFDTVGEGGDYVTHFWRTDGTAGGTLRMTEVNREPQPTDETLPLAPPQVGRVAIASDRVFFLFPGGPLWISDGTAARTAPVHGAPCGGSTVCSELTGSGESAFFAASDDDGAGASLWTSDGSAAGTQPIWWSSEPSGMRVGTIASLGDGRVLFVLEDGVDGDEVWVSDGSPGGTQALVDLRSGKGRSLPRDWTLVAGRLFFTADDGRHGRELWVSDGTTTGTPGTRLVKDTRPGPETSAPRALAAIGGQLVFTATDGAGGLEPWRSDGSLEGTRLLADVFPGAGSSDPLDYTQLGDEVCFNAGRPNLGYELWCVALPAGGSAGE